MRHYDEDMIDFKVSDSYRDFYALQGLTYPSGRRPTSQPPTQPVYDDTHAITQLGLLFKMFREQQDEIERLKKAGPPPPDSLNSFEGVDE